MNQRLKRWIFGLLGKDPEAVVVTFATGDAELCRRMAEEVRALVPGRRHFVATEANWSELRRELRRYRIGLAPVMLARQPSALRRAAYRLAPRKILAYNSRLERHHLRPGLASFLFWRGVPLDRIYLRPWWWPWPKRERTVTPEGDRVLEGRPCSPERRRVAVLSPYFPYPLAHGGAVRIFNLLREAAREFDVELFAFTDDDAVPPATPVLEFCARMVLVTKPRYREPRWSTLLPPEVHEFRSPAMRRAIARERAAFGFEALEVEYTQLAPLLWRRAGGTRRHLRSVCADCAPRADSRRLVGLVSLAPLRNARGARRAPRGSDVAQGRGNARAQGSERGDRKRSRPGTLSAGAGNIRVSACCSSALFATFPTSPPTASSPNASGRCCATSFRRWS